MIKSIWQNKGIYTMALIGFVGQALMQMIYFNKNNILSFYVWLATVIIVSVGIIIEIVIAYRLKRINNFIHSDCEFIKANRENDAKRKELFKQELKKRGGR